MLQSIINKITFSNNLKLKNSLLDEDHVHFLFNFTFNKKYRCHVRIFLIGH